MFWRSPSTTSWASELAAKTRHHRIIEDAASGEYHASVADNRGVQPMAAFDAKKLSQLDWVIAGAGAVALIALFLPWEGWTDGPFSASASGWSQASAGWASCSSLPLPSTSCCCGPTRTCRASLLGRRSRCSVLPRSARSSSSSGGSRCPADRLPARLSAGVRGSACFSHCSRPWRKWPVPFLRSRASGEVLPWAGQSSPSQGVGTPPPGGFTAPSAGFMPMAGSPESPITESGLPDDDGTSPAI